jgi:Spy/CpxP family protein refolding chaperone
MNLFRSLLVSLAVVTSSSLLPAQDQAAPSSPPAEGRRGKGGQRPEGGRGQMMMHPSARVEMLDRELNLTADQKTKLTNIFTQARTEMEGLRGNDGGERGANREKLQQMMQSTRDQVAGVLTDEQKKKFEDMPQMGAGGRGGPKGEKGQRPRGGPGGAGKRKKGDNN